MTRRPALSIVTNPAPMPRPAVDLQEASRIIGISDRSTRRLLKGGKLQGYKPLAGKVCVYMDSIEAFQGAQIQVGSTVQARAAGRPHSGRVDHSAHRQAVSWLKANGYL